jgi:hypothetical protein
MREESGMKANALERFYQRCDAIAPDSQGCLLYLSRSGLPGKVKVKGTIYQAHRLALERKLGRPIAPGRFALHTCNQPACVNPAHLYEDSLPDIQIADGEREPEVWRPIPSYPGYYASSWGRIKGPQGRAMNGHRGRHGCRQVGIRHGGALLCRMVGRLVCEAFHGPAPSPEHEAVHQDSDAENNRPDNLRWATAEESRTRQGRKRGTWPGLDRHYRAQLTLDQVREIKAIYAAARQPGRRIKRGTRQALAARFGVKVSLIKDIVVGRSWVGV